MFLFLTAAWNCFSFSLITERDVFCKQKGSWGEGGWLSNTCMVKGRRSLLYSFLCDSPGVWILCADVSEHCLFHRHRSSCAHDLWRWNRQSVPKCRHIRFRRRGITQKKEYNISNIVKVWNQERRSLPSRNTRNVIYIYMFQYFYAYWWRLALSNSPDWFGFFPLHSPVKRQAAPKPTTLKADSQQSECHSNKIILFCRISLLVFCTNLAKFRGNMVHLFTGEQNKSDERKGCFSPFHWNVCTFLSDYVL